VTVNLFDDVWDEREDDERAPTERLLGPLLGATKWGGTVYLVEPGNTMWPYHWHLGEEEWLLVVSGTPTLRTPDGERVLRPWDVAVFRRGPDGAHQIRNDTGEVVRVLMLSNISDPEICVYPDSGKIGASGGWSRGDGLRVSLRNRPESNLDYYDGEP
jgi:uncharacterized cupin superfamily protein